MKSIYLNSMNILKHERFATWNGDEWEESRLVSLNSVLNCSLLFSTRFELAGQGNAAFLFRSNFTFHYEVNKVSQIKQNRKVVHLY